MEASSSLGFYSNKIICEDTDSPWYNMEVMMDWEDPIMSASAAYVTQGGGDILEIGFGMGIASNYIQSHNISSHTIIENHYKIIENLFSNIFQLVIEYRIIVLIIWIAIMFFLLRKLAKKDNEWHLKDFFKKK